MEEERYDENDDEAYVQFIGKGGGKKGGKGSKNLATSVAGSGIRSGIATRARAQGKVSATSRSRQ